MLCTGARAHEKVSSAGARIEARMWTLSDVTSFARVRVLRPAFHALVERSLFRVRVCSVLSQFAAFPAVLPYIAHDFLVLALSVLYCTLYCMICRHLHVLA
jgi:hypothetical protein